MQVALVAGETSGDLLGAHLLRGMQARWSGLRAAGIGGPQLQKTGFDAWWPSEKLAVRGYVEVLRHYREIVGIRSQLAERLLRQKPDLFIGVDAPDFNLDLELKLRQAGVKTVHFISPSIWAWRPERVHKIGRACDEVLCIFPFEPELYARHGLRATYVGHPLASVIPPEVDTQAARSQLGVVGDGPVLAVLPGSRVSEVKHIAPRMFAAVAQLLAATPHLQVLVPCVPELQPALAAHAQAAGVSERVRLLRGQSHAALAACDLTLIASGTATLEAALFKKPMVIAYNMPALSWWLTQRKRLQPWVGLPNILCGEFVVPELLQTEASADALAIACQNLLKNPAERERISNRLAPLHPLLQRDTVGLACDAIQAIL
jgi:lipid-A-disaccharide synthase